MISIETRKRLRGSAEMGLHDHRMAIAPYADDILALLDYIEELELELGESVDLHALLYTGSSLKEAE